jgi:mannose-6-phosphate isomerase-like protein (cupin superfamily)
MTTLRRITPADEAGELTEFWSQRVLATANGNLFKVAKGTGSTEWHAHPDQDETFLVLDGTVTVHYREAGAESAVELRPGDLLVIPRGVEHRPSVQGEARFMLVGPGVTSNAAGGKPAWSENPAAERTG